MDWGLAAAFWGVSMLLAVTPGVDWAYAIASGVRRRASVVPAVTGLLVGHLTAALVVAAGLAAVIAASEAAMTVLTLAGAGYLVWLGVSALRHPATADLDVEGAPVGRARLFAKGVAISLINPKVILLFLALLPSFVSTTVELPVGVQMIVLGVLHVANCAVVYFSVGYGAAVVLMRRPRVAKVVGVLSGAVMVLLGVVLIGERAVEALA